MQIQDHENKNAFIPMGQLEDTTLPHKSIFMHHSKIKKYMSGKLTSEVFYLQLWFTQVDILSRIQDHENKNADCFSLLRTQDDKKKSKRERILALYQLQ